MYIFELNCCILAIIKKILKIVLQYINLNATIKSLSRVICD